MTREELIKVLNMVEAHGLAEEAKQMAIQALSQEPCDDIAQERYKDLCEYFGGAKDILKSREDFKAWLGRVKWHIHKAEELYKKYEYKKEPCDDAISRQAVLDGIAEWIVDGYADSEADCSHISSLVTHLPPVTQKSGKWIHFAQSDDCSLCGYSTGKYGSPSKFCPNCGARMVEPQESEDKE
jgi:hypothetical protein